VLLGAADCAGRRSAPMESYAGTHRPAAVERRARLGRLGGIDGNEALTVAAAILLTLLLMAEGITLLAMGTLLSVHMIIGLVLIPPVLLKLGSTGYRFARYYTHSRSYVEKGPPPMALRLMAPVLVLTTVGIFVTGVLLLALGHKSDQLVFLHKASFIVWAGAFGIHFLWHLPHMLRSLPAYRRGAGTRRVPGSGLRGLLVAASLGAGVALAITLAGAISGWHGGPPG
jgi:hypothetical protein